MERQDQFREGYAAGKDAVSTDFAKRPWWDRLIFSVVPIISALATECWLANHSSLGRGWRSVIAVIVAAVLAALCSLVLDRLRKLSSS
jgi:hypothetical protein